MLPPIRAGQTCRYRAHSSRCSSESCPTPVRWRRAMPPAPAPATAAKCCRRRAFSTDSACSGRRRRPRVPCRRALPGARPSIIRRRRPAATALALAIFAAALMASPRAFAQSSDEQALRSTLETRLAYVITGDAEVDRISKAGLQGLTLFLAQRTALEGGEPIGLDPARDELAFYPLIYWPIVPSAAKPNREALEHIDAYMKQGGTVLFDTRDAVEAPAGAGGETRGPGMQALRAILSSLDIPELEPVRRDHVLTKTFYLLKDFPGRFSSGQLWVE